MKVRKLYKELTASVADTWHDLSLTSNAKAYSSEIKPQYIKRCGIVHVCGAFSPAKSGTGSSTDIVMGTLPVGYRPVKDIIILCQGSSTRQWLCRITPDGSVCFARYSNGGSYVAYDTSTWLPINAVFACADKLGGGTE